MNDNIKDMSSVELVREMMKLENHLKMIKIEVAQRAMNRDDELSQFIKIDWNLMRRYIG